jgi:MFS family permease
MEPKHHRKPIIALLIANAFSQLGNTLSFLAIPWFVLEITGSASKTGIAVAMGAIPVVVVGLVGGAVVDRLGFRKTSVISDVASGLAVVAIPLMHLTTGIQYWQLLVLIFLGALLDMPGVTARRSLYPDLANLAGYKLERANASYSLVNRMALLLGPPLAGVLVTLIGASNVLWFTGLTFVVSSLVVQFGVPDPGVAEVPDPSTVPTRYIQEVIEGFQFIWQERTIFWMIVMTSVGSLLAEPLYSVVLPVYGREVLGSAAALGLAFSGLALGSIAGNLLYAWRGYRLPRRIVVIGGFAARAGVFCLLVFQPSALGLALLMFASGVVLEPVNPIFHTILQERVPARMRGRVFAAVMAIGMASMPVGMVAYGFLIELAGMQATLVVLALVNLLLPVMMLFTRALRNMDAISNPDAPTHAAAA